ncbi:MAG: hypothetical protein P0Y53_21375 [Candidatus Pseudobacter hemicellulosilyticus]|uniref:Uncharacterized protein n=1 Tax=Candidatus Pseudobacter hemicellulosilyticus TaxID=3121375 RepID=A0AAJ5WR69_9BACT|nr:MAG: hypothetical protein P0Y53_21375 [Pseudobacter sp.]
MTCRHFYQTLLLAACLLLGQLASLAQPDLTHTIRTANGLRFYTDRQQSQVYYYLPGDLVLGRRANGQPDLNFVLMRYDGALHESIGLRFRNILTMRLLLKPISADSLLAARRELEQQSGQVLLKPLPISQVEGLVVFTPIGQPDSARQVQKGELAVESDGGYSTAGTFWQERYFTLFLDINSAMLLREAFTKDLTAISFAWAFHCKGYTERRMLRAEGSSGLDSLFGDSFTEAVDTSAATDSASIREVVVKSDAFRLSVDTSRLSEHIRLINIDGDLPAGYALLNIRNYDFANNLRTDLYEKKVELQATGAGGNPVSAAVSFLAKDKDVTSINMRFRYAVRPDQPYRYRVRELLKDGREWVSDWQTISIWSSMLDVTTRPAPAPVQP